MADRALSLLTGVRSSLACVRVMSDPEQVLAEAGRLTVERCGLDRCIAFAVRDDELVAHSVCFGEDEGWAARTLQIGQGPEGRQRLRHDLVETESVRRRMAALVPDAQNDPHTPRALVEETMTRSYVAAPIVCEDRVVGFLHADRFFAGRDVDQVDREALASFAAGVGVVLERLLLHRHLERQRRRLHELGATVTRLADDVTLVDVSLAEAPEPEASAVSDLRADRSVRARLSPREREVLDLLVAGATNAEISRRLYISEGTTKAHVRHILRKLGAANRAEAVAKFLRGG